MKERLIQLLDLEQLSPSKFADIIGVQRSSISHVISGRNKPSFDFLQKTLKAFPGLNASWLMMGEGNMYEQMGRNITGNLFDAPITGAEESSPGNISDLVGSHIDAVDPETPISNEEEPDMQAERSAHAEDMGSVAQAEDIAAAVSTGKKKIVQVMVIYEDDTFKAFTPAH
ncbi:MAG: helix-turn-helix domain-containing protein [Bacteroidales bacterium]|nr:helix-turn-helix domain-containing protein [Bacteroidales bacterium]